MAEASKSKERKPKPLPLNKETARELGPEGMKRLNPKAKTPMMLPRGAQYPLIYIVGDYPRKKDDEDGIPFSGRRGAVFTEKLPRGADRKIAYDNIIRTHPKDEVTAAHYAAFAPLVEEAIRKAQPSVVVTVGAAATSYFTGLEAKDLYAVRGKPLAAKIGSYVCWIVPTIDPSTFIESEDERVDKVAGKEWLRALACDMKVAYELALEDTVPPFTEREAALGSYKKLSTIDEVEAAFEYLSKQPVVGWDIETNCFRPYSAGSKILTMAFSDGKHTFSLPFQHSQAKWSAKHFAAVDKMVLAFLRRQTDLIVAHNLPFELEWAFHRYGNLVFDGRFACSLQAGFALDPGPPGENQSAGLSLHTLCIRYFGLPLKSLSNVTVSNLDEAALDNVLKYNALDARWCAKVFNKQWPDIERLNLKESYRRQIERIRPVVHAQATGLPVDQNVVQGFQKRFEAELKAAEEAIREDAQVKAFEKKYAISFMPTSQKEVGRLLGDFLALPGIKVGSSYKTDEKHLRAFADKVDIINPILDLRGIHKLKGTYVDRFDMRNPNSYVYPDGRVHCTFGITRTRTARLQSEDPNNQNWPKRKHREIRSQLKAPKGWVWVSSDQGQIEARVLAMESRDPNWVRMIKEKYDVHAEWSEKIAALPGCTFAARYGNDAKVMRSEAKNKWVFPAFFGSSLTSIINNLDLPPEPAEELFEEFWETFAGVKRWQKKKWSTYEEKGFVRSLTGRVRWAPLSWNMVINTPVQSCASDITVDAMYRLFKLAIETDRPWLAPVLQVHDDLTALVPEKNLDEAIDCIVRAQLGFSASWVNVPLSVEVEVGPDLASMKHVGTWTTDQLE